MFWRFLELDLALMFAGFLHFGVQFRSWQKGAELSHRWTEILAFSRLNYLRHPQCSQ